MNSLTVGLLVRHLIGWAGAAIGLDELKDENTLGAIAGGAVAFGTVIWSYAQKKGWVRL